MVPLQCPYPEEPIAGAAPAWAETSQGALWTPTDRFAPSHGVHSPCPRCPALPQIPVKLTAVLTERSLLEVLPRNLMENCVLPAWNSLPGANAVYI